MSAADVAAASIAAPDAASADADAPSASDQLHAKAATLANLLGHLSAGVPVQDDDATADAADAPTPAVPLPKGVEVLLTEIIVMADRVKEENDL
ncbi:hypothetical protein HK405_015094, partial [Cladochytrium tenue]